MQHKEFHVKQDWQLKEQAGAELGQAHIVLVESTNFPFYNILTQLEIVKIFIASYS